MSSQTPRPQIRIFLYFLWEIGLITTTLDPCVLDKPDFLGTDGERTMFHIKVKDGVVIIAIRAQKNRSPIENPSKSKQNPDTGSEGVWGGI